MDLGEGSTESPLPMAKDTGREQSFSASALRFSPRLKLVTGGRVKCVGVRGRDSPQKRLRPVPAKERSLVWLRPLCDVEPQLLSMEVAVWRPGQNPRHETH